MKKFLALLLAVLMLTASCAFAEANFDLVDREIAGEISIYTYYADSDITYIDYAVAKMAEKYPNLKINIIHRADSDGTAIRTWAAVGELPDIFDCTNAETLDAVIANGDCYIMDDVLEKTGYYTLYSTGAANELKKTQADGHKYNVGVDAARVLTYYYNKTVFAELGLTEPTNFEEFKNCIVTLKEAGKIPVALFAAEQWPGMAQYELACVAEGAYGASTAVADGEARYEDDEAYLRAAKKLQEVVELGAFGTGALSTNASQAFELFASGQAGMLANHSRHWATIENDGYGDNVGWCHFNVYADADKAEEVSVHAVGGLPARIGGLCVNANPPSGLDPEVLGELMVEFSYYTSLCVAENGMMNTLLGDFPFNGCESYTDFYNNFKNYVTFTYFPWQLEGQLCADLGNAVEMMVTGNYTAEEFIDEMVTCGY